ncbi:MAG: signal peptidase II [Lachnospiraceae bacterium]|nr:signal peptidase II [Lachnospiraceae bacterium]
MSKYKKKMLAMDILIALLLIVIDQFTKFLAVARLKGKEAFVLIDGVLELDYLENRGAAFGMLQNQKVLLVAVGVIFLTAICFFIVRIPDEKRYLTLHILASAIIAGGLGNMIDRLTMDYVVDFISFILIDYPIFNVADIYVVVATICVFILFIFVYKEEDLAFLGKKEKSDR